MKTSELTGAALDWAVAKRERDSGANWRAHAGHRFSTDWAQGGPIIERELLMLEPVFWTTEGWHWVAYVLGPDNLDENFEQRGPTPLIAAMRCYVASKLGDEIEIPEELL
jgi:hypothetical protein